MNVNRYPETTFKDDNISSIRSGCIDIWNAYMLKNAIFSKNDIPLCPSTATELPKSLIGFDQAKTIHNQNIKKGNKNYHVDAFIHFYIDDHKFDGVRTSIWLFPEKALEIIKHFDGIICPDFSLYLDFPKPIKYWNCYRMNAFGFWIGSLGIPVINNARWCTESSWSYCFDGITEGGIISIGTVASKLKKPEYRIIFEKGLDKLIELKKPSAILIYGSANYDCLEKLKEKNINIASFKSNTALAFEKRSKKHE